MTKLSLFHTEKLIGNGNKLQIFFDNVLWGYNLMLFTLSNN